MNNNEQKEVLIAKVFCGRYLFDGENIGHEVIDFFDTDNGERYLYIAPDGIVNDHPNVEAVLLIRSYGNTLGEVVGLACDLENVCPPRNKEEALPMPYGSVSYNGVSVDKIFAENVYKGEKEEAFRTLSYHAGSFKVPSPKHQIFISMGKAKNEDERRHPIELICNDKEQWGHQRTYISSVDHPEAYARLKELMADKEKWEEQIGIKTVKSASCDKTQPSFLEIIRKEDDELVFSNLLAHYLSCSKKGFEAFTKEVLGITDFGPHPTIIRESKDHVDLWIENDRHIVVIENKIHSAINGIKPDCKETQLSRYRKAAEKECKDRTVKCYLFAPDFNNVDEVKAKAARFSVKHYSELYAFFKTNKSLFTGDERYGVDEHYDEFLIGLKRHTLAPAERNEQAMLERFSYMIDRAKQS